MAGFLVALLATIAAGAYFAQRPTPEQKRTSAIIEGLLYQAEQDSAVAANARIPIPTDTVPEQR